MPRLHVGTTPWQSVGDRPAAVLCAQAERAEQLGFDSFFVPENHFSGSGAIPDPLMLLGAVAGCTQAIRLGTTSFLLPIRHPMQAAEQVAVLDQLSGGRVILGMGRGIREPLFTAFGVDRTTKRELFAGTLEAMRRAWRGEELAGGARLAPLPVQRPHPPLWVAAFGPKALAQAGGLGLTYLASPMESIGLIEANLAVQRAAAAAAGVALPAECAVMRTVFIAEDRALLATVREAVRAADVALAQGAGGPLARLQQGPADERALIGTPDEVRATLRAWVARLGITHLIATRLRLEGIDPAVLDRSLVHLAQLRREEA